MNPDQQQPDHGALSNLFAYVGMLLAGAAAFLFRKAKRQPRPHGGMSEEEIQRAFAHAMAPINRQLSQLAEDLRSDISDIRVGVATVREELEQSAVKAGRMEVIMNRYRDRFDDLDRRMVAIESRK